MITELDPTISAERNCRLFGMGFGTEKLLTIFSRPAVSASAPFRVHDDNERHPRQIPAGASSTCFCVARTVVNGRDGSATVAGSTVFHNFVHAAGLSLAETSIWKSVGRQQKELFAGAVDCLQRSRIRANALTSDPRTARRHKTVESFAQVHNDFAFSFQQ